MDVDEVAYPEGHTLWDKVSVPDASKLTLGDFIEFFKREHKLVLQVRVRVRGLGLGLGAASSASRSVAPRAAVTRSC